MATLLTESYVFCYVTVHIKYETSNSGYRERSIENLRLAYCLRQI